MSFFKQIIFYFLNVKGIMNDLWLKISHNLIIEILTNQSRHLAVYERDRSQDYEFYRGRGTFCKYTKCRCSV